MNINKLDNAEREIEKITGSKLTLGRMLWALRKCDELTQTEFAKKLGISNSHLCDIEHDKKIVSPELARNYAKILGHSEKQFIRLAIQASLDKAEMSYEVEIVDKKKKKERTPSAGNLSFA